MKKINRKLIKGTNWALAGLLTLLGFSGCDFLNGSPDEYGCPNADYEFSGKVTNEDNTPINGINVVVKSQYGGMTYSTNTESEGSYKVDFNETTSDKFTVITSDIDGEKNGSYQSDTTEVEITSADYYKKGKDWYKGAARKTVNVILKKK